MKLLHLEGGGSRPVAFHDAVTGMHLEQKEAALVLVLDRAASKEPCSKQPGLRETLRQVCVRFEVRLCAGLHSVSVVRWQQQCLPPSMRLRSLVEDEAMCPSIMGPMRVGCTGCGFGSSDAAECAMETVTLSELRAPLCDASADAELGQVVHALAVYGPGLFVTAPGAAEQLTCDINRAHSLDIITLEYKGGIPCFDYRNFRKLSALGLDEYPVLARVAFRANELLVAGGSIPYGGPTRVGEERTHARCPGPGQKATPSIAQAFHFDEAMVQYCGEAALKRWEADPSHGCIPLFQPEPLPSSITACFACFVYPGRSWRGPASRMPGPTRRTSSARAGAGVLASRRRT